MWKTIKRTTAAGKNHLGEVLRSVRAKRNIVKIGIAGVLVLAAGLGSEALLMHAAATANNNNPGTQTAKDQVDQSLSSSSSTGSNTASTDSATGSTGSSTSNNVTTTSNTSSSPAGPVQGSTQVTVNGQQINVPTNGSINQTTTTGGQTTNVSVSNSSSVGSTSDNNVTTTNLNVSSSSNGQEDAP